MRRTKFSLGACLPCFASACGTLRASICLVDNGVEIGISICISVIGSGWAKQRLAEEDSDSEEGVDGGRSNARIDPPPSDKPLENSVLGARKINGEGGCEFGVGGRSVNGGGVREGGIARSRTLEVFLLKELLDVEVDKAPGDMSGGDMVPLPGCELTLVGEGKEGTADVRSECESCLDPAEAFRCSFEEYTDVKRT